MTPFKALDCSKVSNRANRTVCLRLRPVVHYLQNVSSQAVIHTRGVIRQVRALVRDHIPSRRGRVKKGLIDLGGHLLHGLFGVARDKRH